jgi:hypothetical protein
LIAVEQCLNRRTYVTGKLTLGQAATLSLSCHDKTTRLRGSSLQILLGKEEDARFENGYKQPDEDWGDNREFNGCGTLPSEAEPKNLARVAKIIF